VRPGLGILLALVCGCSILEREVREPAGQEPVVLVGSASLPAPMDDIARHPWVALRDDEGVWERWEVMCCPDGSEMGTVKRRRNVDPLSDYGAGGGNVAVHAVHRGVRAREAIACVRREGPRYPHRKRYRAWPGPNSNTFVDWLIRQCDLDVELPAASIGRDYRGLIGVSTTAGGTGVQLETPVAGLKVGLREGIEVHVLGLVLGVDLWPPALVFPMGRLGFADR
jgi:hypothetical protein